MLASSSLFSGKSLKTLGPFRNWYYQLKAQKRLQESVYPRGAHWLPIKYLLAHRYAMFLCSLDVEI